MSEPLDNREYEEANALGRADDNFKALVGFAKSGNRAEHDELARMLGVPARDLDHLWDQTRARLHLSPSGSSVEIDGQRVPPLVYPALTPRPADADLCSGACGSEIDRVAAENREAVAETRVVFAEARARTVIIDALESVLADRFAIPISELIPGAEPVRHLDPSAGTVLGSLTMAGDWLQNTFMLVLDRVSLMTRFSARTMGDARRRREQRRARERAQHPKQHRRPRL